jgi:hypothetical protein
MRKTPVVLGVLSIIFGSITAVTSFLALGLGPLFSKLAQLTGSIAGQTATQRAQIEASQASFAHLTGYLMVSAAVFVVMSIALVVVGIGLYRRRAWARRATVAWALTGIVLVVANFIFSVAWLQPHQRAWQHEVYAARGVTVPFELGAASQISIALFSMFLYCAFPAVLLALIGRRSAARDFLPAA